MCELALRRCASKRLVHVLIWTAFKITHNQYETGRGFRPHPRECLYASGNIISLGKSSNCHYRYQLLIRPRKVSTILLKKFSSNHHCNFRFSFVIFQNVIPLLIVSKSKKECYGHVTFRMHIKLNSDMSPTPT